MRMFASILSKLFLLFAFVVFIGGMINTLGGTEIGLRLRGAPLGLPSDWFSTLAFTAFLLILYGIFWFLSNIKLAFSKMKKHPAVTVALLGGVIIAVILVVLYLPQMLGTSGVEQYATNGNIKKLEAVLEEKTASLEKLNKGLIMAASREHPEAILLLVKAGADVNALSETGSRPLEYAVISRNMETIEMLIKNKADVNLRDTAGRNSAMLAVSYRAMHLGTETNEEEILEIVQMLTEAGLDLKAQDSQGKTLLMMAQEEGYTKVAGYISENLKSKI